MQGGNSLFHKNITPIKKISFLRDLFFILCITFSHYAAIFAPKSIFITSKYLFYMKSLFYFRRNSNCKMGIANVPESGSRSGSKQSLINFSIVTRLMALIVASLFSVFCMGLFSSCSSDEDDELKVETQLLISLKEGSTGIDGMVYVFPDGLYDPTTFKASTLGTI